MANVIDIVIRAKDATVAAWQSVSKHAAAFGKRISAGIGGAVDIAKKAAVAVGILGAAVAAGARKAVQAYMVQAAAEAKLTSTLKATGYAAGFTRSELVKHAAALQKLTGVGDEVIISMQGMLASFNQIRGDNFRRATEAALDMSAVMRKAGAGAAEVEGAALQLGKALQDPVGQLGMLSRVGISFTAQQKDQIKAMVDAGDVAGAQSLILGELESRFGGTAKAAADAQHGIAQLKAAFGDTLEAIGGAILGVDSFDGAIAKMTKALEDLQASGQIDLWAERAAAAFAKVRQEIGYVIDWVKPLFDMIGGGIRNIAAFSGALSARMGEASKDPLWKKLTGVTAVNLIRGAAADAGESRATDEQDIAAETKAALDAIKTRKAAEAEAVAAKEKAEMQAAQKLKAVDAEAAEADADANQKAIDAEKEKARLVEERLDLEKQIKAAGEDIGTEAHREEAQAAIEGADITADKARKRLDVLARTTDEQRDAEKARRQEEFDGRRFHRLNEKAKTGVRMSKFERDFVERGKLRMEVNAAEEAKAAAQNNLDRMDKDEAAKRRQEMVDRLGDLKALLARNLEASRR
jgi:hypothetical protein